MQLQIEARSDLKDQWVFIIGGIRNAWITTGFSSRVSRHLPGTGRRTSSRATVFYVRIEGAVFAFLECGIPENGVARVRCSGCGHDFFVAFSCRTRVVCPNCTTRRSLWFGEKVREIVHSPTSAGSRCGSSPSSPIYMRSLRSSNTSGNRPRTPRP